MKEEFYRSRIDLDHQAKIPNVLIMNGGVLLIVFFFGIMNESLKFLVNHWIYGKNKQIIYYQIKNFKLRLLCDFTSFVCAYFALIGGFAIRINQKQEI